MTFFHNPGKRDVATLYEYWIFFKLLDLFSSFFELEPKSIDKLIGLTNDKLGLQLKSGKHIPLEGTYKMSGRNMKVKFSYNRTFSKAKKYPDEGSWTVNMRPDYTLSLWPSDFDETEAEKQEAIVHIHFDAKYKIENLKYLFDTENDMDSELKEQKSGVYKRADLLKMHAYKDAIRRTVGAYVIYPGSNENSTNQNQKFKGFHEVLPGLGAFAINPSKDGNDMEAIEKFIADVTNRFISKSSRYEKMSYNTYDANKDENNLYLKDSIPEKYGTERSKPPADIFVLVGYCRPENKGWIESEGKYNIRFDDKISADLLNAKYLLLYHDKNEKGVLWKINEKLPIFQTKEELIKSGYKNPSRSSYQIFEIEEIKNKEFINLKLNVANLNGYSYNNKPFVISLLELLGSDS